MACDPVQILFPACDTIGPVATIAALRLYPVTDIGAGQTIVVIDTSTEYVWSPSSLADDDGVTTIRPFAIAPLQAGRWLLSGAGAFISRSLAASSGGAGLLGFLQSGAGATPRTVQDELRETVRPEQFGASGLGVLDDTDAIQRAIDRLGASGGNVILRGRYRVDGPLALNPGVELVGDYNASRGRTTIGSGAATDYSLMSSSIRLASTATITLNGSAGLSGLVIYRRGMVFPATPSTTQAGFAGTAITVSGDDPTVDGCLIMGFNKGIYASGAGRLRIYNNNFDNLNNIEVTDCDDRTYISDNHSWPFATIVSGQIWQNLVRSGKNIWLHDFVDWGSVINCFAYGYQRGLVFENVDNCTAILMSVDNAFDNGALNTGSIGIEVIGNCHDTKLIACQTAAASVAGVNINVTAGRTVHVSGHSAWGLTGPQDGHGVLVTLGDAQITGGSIRGAKNPVSVANDVSKVNIDAMTFRNTASSSCINAAVVTGNVRIGKNDYGEAAFPSSTNIQASVIPSADPLPCNAYPDEFIVTGTTNIGGVTGGYKGRRIMLFFSSGLTVFNGTGSVNSIRLVGGTNFVAGANSVLYLYHNGIQWFDEGRA